LPPVNDSLISVRSSPPTETLLKPDIGFREHFMPEARFPRILTLEEYLETNKDELEHVYTAIGLDKKDKFALPISKTDLEIYTRKPDG
jgi:hypothetical protein